MENAFCVEKKVTCLGNVQEVEEVGEVEVVVELVTSVTKKVTWLETVRLVVAVKVASTAMKRDICPETALSQGEKVEAGLASTVVVMDICQRIVQIHEQLGVVEVEDQVVKEEVIWLCKLLYLCKI